MLTSNEHSVVFRTTTNGSLCHFLRSVCIKFLPPSLRKMAANVMNVNVRDTLPVLYCTYNIRYSFEVTSICVYLHCTSRVRKM